jgi:hypothetical protein
VSVRRCSSWNLQSRGSHTAVGRFCGSFYRSSKRTEIDESHLSDAVLGRQWSCKQMYVPICWQFQHARQILYLQTDQFHLRHMYYDHLPKCNWPFCSEVLTIRKETVCLTAKISATQFFLLKGSFLYRKRRTALRWIFEAWLNVTIALLWLDRGFPSRAHPVQKEDRLG